MISMCSQSAPHSSIRFASSAKRAKSDDSMDGAMIALGPDPELMFRQVGTKGAKIMRRKAVCMRHFRLLRHRLRCIGCIPNMTHRFARIRVVVLLSLQINPLSVPTERMRVFVDGLTWVLN